MWNAHLFWPLTSIHAKILQMTSSVIVAVVVMLLWQFEEFDISRMRHWVTLIVMMSGARPGVVSFIRRCCPRLGHLCQNLATTEPLHCSTLHSQLHIAHTHCLLHITHSPLLIARCTQKIPLPETGDLCNASAHWLQPNFTLHFEETFFSESQDLELCHTLICTSPLMHWSTVWT